MRMGILVALGMALTTGCGPQEEGYAEDSWVVLTGDIEAVRITVEQGSIVVFGGKDEGATLETRVHWTDDRAPRWSASIDDGTLYVESSCPRGAPVVVCRTEQILDVPRDVPVWVDVGVGSLQMSQFTSSVIAEVERGDVVLDRVNHYALVQVEDGDILAKRSYGDLDLYTQRGDIYGRSLNSMNFYAHTFFGTVTALFTGAPVVVDVESGEGDVRVQVPDDGTEFSVNAWSDDGKVIIGVETESTSKRSIAAGTASGDVEISAK